MGDVEAIDQDLGHEVLGAPRHHLGIEGELEQEIYAQRLQMPRLDAEGRQAEMGILRPEETARMRLEGEDSQRRLLRTRDFRRLANHHLVAEMHAVEIPQRHHGTVALDGHIL